jgi:hypothetical protein
MVPPEQAAQILTQAVDGLAEPYRQNTVRWLERCMQHPVMSLEDDLNAFLDNLHPVVRDSFISHTRQLLDDALLYFGRDAGERLAHRSSRVSSLAQLLMA